MSYYLSGCSNKHLRARAREAGIGLMIQPGNGYVRHIPDYSMWAADNGCFNPNTYVGHEKWLAWIDSLPRANCLFVVVPDVSRQPDGSLGGDPKATWEQFQVYGPQVQAMGFPAALVAQNGIENMPNLAEQLQACDWLFIGGNTEWKEGPGIEVARLALAAGKRAHMGRVNSYRRYVLASKAGLDSVDGTFIGFAPRHNTLRVERWINRGAQLELA